MCNTFIGEHSSSGTTLLLQEQQVLLMKVLNQQDELKKAQSNFGKRMDNLESQVTSIVRDKTPTSSSSSPTNERGIRLKRVVTKNLSVGAFIRVLYVPRSVNA